jgi:DNA-binding LacI/PurR family transcriptional regulator
MLPIPIKRRGPRRRIGFFAFDTDHWTTGFVMGATAACRDAGWDLIVAQPLALWSLPVGGIDGLLTLWGAHLPLTKLGAPTANLPIVEMATDTAGPGNGSVAVDFRQGIAATAGSRTSRADVVQMGCWVRPTDMSRSLRAWPATRSC